MKENCNYLEIMQVACDEICKHLGQLKQEDLEEQCKNCPLEKVLDGNLK